MNEKDPSEHECNECTNEMSGLQGGVKIMAIPNKKARLCAHQPVPWKGTNAE